MSQDEVRRKEEYPQVTVEEARSLAASLYNLKVLKCKELDSYDDRNFFVETETGDKFVFKVHNGVESLNRAFVEAQNATLLHLSSKGFGVPTPVASPLTHAHISDATLKLKDGTERRHAVRLLVWVEGAMLCDVAQTPQLLFKVGAYVGRISQELQSCEHPALKRVFAWDLAQIAGMLDFVHALTTPEQKATVEAVIHAYQQEVVPRLPELPRAVVQNDANDHNVIIAPDGEVAGVIDWGDMIYTQRANEIAISMAYIMLDKEDPLAAGAQLYAGFVSAAPLLPVERASLRILTACRLAMSLTMGAFSYSQNPGNEYLLITAEPAWKALRILWTSPPEDFDSAIEQAAAQFN